ncbi:MAG: cyclic nucleotide-binding domain-containing protein, partial [Proteobacteria bacterium]|nr:cyclic nucleotide-binding domain-containing protein [Pseudomonadota bacterium]
MTGEILNVIAQSELFAGLDRSLLGKIAAAAEKTSARAGEILFRQGDPADAVWGVLSGRITKTIRNEDGREMTVGTIEAGEVFGEVAVLDWGPRRAEAAAAEDSILFRINRRQIEIYDMAALASLAAPPEDDSEPGGKRLMFDAPEGLLERSAGTSGAVSEPPRNMRDVGLMAVVVSDYSRDMMADASGTLKALRAGIRAIEKAVADHGGTIIGQAGESIIARFPDALAGLRAAKSIQSRIAPRTGTATAAKTRSLALFRLGVHTGDIMVDGDRHLGPAIGVALRVAQHAEPGDVYLSGVVREQVKEDSRVEFRFLGNQKFRGIEQSVPVYSAQPLPLARWIWARADSLISRRLRPAAAIGAAVALMAVVWVTAQQFEGNGQPAPVATIPIAVLPFANAGDRENDYLADGLSQEARSALMAFPRLRISGEKSANYFRDKNTSPEEIADILQVSYLLLGSIEQPDGKIRLAVQLFDAVRATELWTRTYSEPELNLAEFRRDIAQSVASALDLSRDAGNGAPHLTAAARDPGAYGLYLQAEFLGNQGMQKVTLSALPLLREAVEIEPRFAEAWALLAKLYRGINRPPHTTGYGQDELDRLSEAALAKALEYSPDSPKVVVTAAILTRDLEVRDRLTARAVALYPDDPDALMALAGTYA